MNQIMNHKIYIWIIFKTILRKMQTASTLTIRELPKTKKTSVD